MNPAGLSAAISRDPSCADGHGRMAHPCPRLPVWEDAHERGFVERHHQEGVGTFISVTPLGREFLDKHRPRRPTLP